MENIQTNTLIESPHDNIIADHFNYHLLSKKNLTVSYLVKKDNILENLYSKSSNLFTQQFIKKQEQEDINSKKGKTQPLRKQIKNDDTNLLLNACKRLKESNLNKLSSLVIKQDAFQLEQNVTTRDHMEDYLVIKKNYMNDRYKILYILCDGHSGDQVAKIAVERLPIIFSCALLETNFEVEKSINESFRKMDEELTEFTDTGATCCLVYICVENGNRVVYSGNVGDSRTILVKQKETIRLSFDHKANEKSEMKRVKQDGGLIIRGRLYGTLAITRALGDFNFKIDVNGLSNIPYVTRNIIEESDKYIICGSDGIWDVINEEKATILINESKIINSTDLCQLFIKKAIEYGSKDNISCIVIKLN